METVSSASRIGSFFYKKTCGETFFLLDPVLDIFCIFVCTYVAGFFREKACEPMPLSPPASSSLFTALS